MKQVIRRYKLLVLAFMLLVSGLLVWINYAHQAEDKRLHHQLFQGFHLDATNQINLLINEQKNASLALALILSENASIQTLLSSECCTYVAGLKQAAEKIAQQSTIKEIWLHAINHAGISMERSWVERRGDSLLKVREDLVHWLKSPSKTPQTSVSTGLFTMTFKATVPVWQAEKFLGVVEVISKFQPLVERLDLKATQSIIIADKRHKSKLTLAAREAFIGDYHLVNTPKDAQLLERIDKLGIEKIIQSDGYLFADDWVYAKVAISGIKGEPEGYWIIARQLEDFDFGAVELLLNRYLIIGFVVVSMLVLLGVALISRQQVYLERNYYRDVIDSASDILYVTNLKRITEANRHFFDLFQGIKTLDEFHIKYRCVCDVFEPGEGLLSPYVDDIYWIQYILNHPEKTHKAKIIRNNQTYYYAIKIQALKDELFGRFTVAMQDVSEFEKVQHQLAYLSQTDELTGIGNRLSFNKSLSQEMARANRYKVPLCLVMFDIDYFKSINDTLGHDVGDQVLIELCQVIKQNLRETDIFCRYGGEEFIVMLLETDMGVAQDITERLLHQVAEHAFTAIPGQVITCSFGLTCYNEKDTETSLLKRVDEALYSSKHDGRNRMTIY